MAMVLSSRSLLKIASITVLGIISGLHLQTGAGGEAPQPSRSEQSTSDFLVQPEGVHLYNAYLSPKTKRFAYVAGSFSKQGSIFVEQPQTTGGDPVKVWSSTAAKSGVEYVAWSPSESSLAFFAKTYDPAEPRGASKAAVYVVDLATLASRVVYEFGRVRADENATAYSINDGAGIAWLGEDTICFASDDNSIVAVKGTNASVIVVSSKDQRVLNLCSYGGDALRIVRGSRLKNEQHQLAFEDLRVSTFRDGREQDVRTLTAADVGTPLVVRFDDTGNRLMLIDFIKNPALGTIVEIATAKRLFHLPVIAVEPDVRHSCRPIGIRDNKAILLDGQLDMIAAKRASDSMAATVGKGGKPKDADSDILMGEHRLVALPLDP